MMSMPGGSMRTSISISRSSSWPSRSILRKRWRVSASRGWAGSSVEKPIWRGRGSSASSTRSSAASSARAFHARGFLFARHLHRDFRQFLDDRVHLAADVADLGELGRLDLHEGGFGQSCQAPRDLGLAAAGGADHQDVLRRDLVAQRLVDLHATPAVAQRDGHGTLGGLLADDVLVQLLDDLARRHLPPPSSSMVRLRLV